MTIIGNEDFQWETIRAAAILSAAGEYIIGSDNLATDPLWKAVALCNELGLHIDFQLGALTNCKLEIEKSFDGEFFVPIGQSTPSGGDAGLVPESFTRTADYKGDWCQDKVLAKYIKIKWTPTGATIGVATITGSGLDDATSGGTYSFDGVKTIKVEIDLAAATDTFKWSDDGGVTWTEDVVITGSAQTLSNGITITFAATTGHTLADYWTIVAGSSLKIQAGLGKRY